MEGHQSKGEILYVSPAKVLCGNV